MKDKHVNNASNDSTNTDYDIVHSALAAKPALLKTILNQAKINDAKTDANTSSIPERMAQAEKKYQAALNKQSEHIFKLFQALPIDQKIELLAFAEEIGKVNDKVRKLASVQMRAEQTQAIANHKTEIAAQNKVNPISLQPIQTKINQPPPEPPQEKGLISQIGLGSPAAVTVNFPFTVIPGLPALSKILEKIDKTTHFDLGFTIKGIADRAPNPNGGHDLLYRLNYVGAGIMSSQFNVQVAPVALKVQESADQDTWGGNSSIFTKHRTDNTGEKFSVNFNDSDGSISYAHEYSYQKPSNKIISTLTGGHHFGRDSSLSLRIPAEFVPTLDSIVEALPNKEEADIILDRIAKVIPVNQAVEITAVLVDKIDAHIMGESPSLTASIHLLKQKVAESGLSAKEQADVIARICENCKNNATNDSLPVVHIIEQLSLQQAATIEQ